MQVNIWEAVYDRPPNYKKTLQRHERRKRLFLQLNKFSKIKIKKLQFLFQTMVAVFYKVSCFRAGQHEGSIFALIICPCRPEQALSSSPQVAAQATVPLGSKIQREEGKAEENVVTK